MKRQAITRINKEHTTVPTGVLGQRDAVRARTEQMLPPSSSSQMLDTGTRASVESRFSHDFSQVPANTAKSCPVSPRRCPFGGACHTCPVQVQAKLSVGQPGDKYEQEADRVAEQVMRMSEPPTWNDVVVNSRSQQLSTQQFCPECEDEKVRRQPEVEEEEEEQVIQPKGYTGHSLKVIPNLGSHIKSLKGGGQPLSDSVRTYFEPRFGYDFSHVRIHADANAAEAAQAVEARAFTIGRDVVFGEGQYVPGTSKMQRLIAHELTHVVQQSRQSNLHRKHEYGTADDCLGREAGQIENAAPDKEPDAIDEIASNVSALPGSIYLQRLGANPGCTNAERRTIHQAIFNARGWLNKAFPQLEKEPLSTQAIAHLRRNFGPRHGVTANAPLIARRLRVAYREISRIPFSCAGATDTTCAARPCGYATAGSHAATICSNATLGPGTDWRYQAGCVLHESLHAAFSRFTVDRYSGWRGVVGRSTVYPGAGTDPLLNADSYTTLAMDLS